MSTLPRVVRYGLWVLMYLAGVVVSALSLPGLATWTRWRPTNPQIVVVVALFAILLALVMRVLPIENFIGLAAMLVLAPWGFVIWRETQLIHNLVKGGSALLILGLLAPGVLVVTVITAFSGR